MKPTMDIKLPTSITNAEEDRSSTPSSTTSSTVTSAAPSQTQTPLSSALTTPNRVPHAPVPSASANFYHCRRPQLDGKGQPLDVLARHYPPPEKDLDIMKALALPPASVPKIHKRRKEETSEERRADLERWKRNLRELG